MIEPPLAHTDSSHTGTAKRNYAGGVAGVDAGKALIYEHLPACMKEYHPDGGNISMAQITLTSGFQFQPEQAL